MSIVKVKTKGQVTLPSAIREKIGLNIGDLLLAKVEQGNIVLSPQTLVDRHIAESMEQIRQGQFYGPFDTAEEMTASLRQNGKRSKKTSKRTPRK
jgi:AbrB family looped-hinge helix DNA binding protein